MGLLNLLEKVGIAKPKSGYETSDVLLLSIHYYNQYGLEEVSSSGITRSIRDLVFEGKHALSYSFTPFCNYSSKLNKDLDNLREQGKVKKFFRYFTRGGIGHPYYTLTDLARIELEKINCNVPAMITEKLKQNIRHDIPFAKETEKILDSLKERYLMELNSERETVEKLN